LNTDATREDTLYKQYERESFEALVRFIDS